MYAFLLSIFLIFTSLSLIKNKNKAPELDKIIKESLSDNPKNIKGFLPLLPKIITKTGLVCEFPFIYNQDEHYDKCMRHANGKYYCKVTKKTKIISDNLLKIENQYFDECMTLDETEQYFNSLVEESYDFKNKLLIDLFSDIRVITTESKVEKLNLLFKDSEVECKTNKFNLDCLYTQFLDPISKDSSINKTVKEKIDEVLKKYKKSLSDYVSSSIKEKFAK